MEYNDEQDPSGRIEAAIDGLRSRDTEVQFLDGGDYRTKLDDLADARKTIDALVAALSLVRSMRTVEALAPSAYQSEVDNRLEAWGKIDAEIDTALALARGGK